MTEQPILNAFGVVVADMAASLAFYRELGLDIPADADGAPHVEVALGGGMRLMFDHVDVVRSIDPDWSPPVGGSRIGLAFECSSPTSVDGVHARLVAAGHRSTKAPWDAPWGQRYAMLVDPDGNGVDLYAAAPRGLVASDLSRSRCAHRRADGGARKARGRRACRAQPIGR